jgi:hypothetical protein
MRKIEYNPKQVRIFSILLFALIAFITFRLTASADGIWRIILFSAEGLILLFILLKPKFFYPVFRTALIISSFIGNIIFNVISTVVFYLILTPIALVMRLFGKTFLIHRTDTRLDSYYEVYVPHAGIDKQF